MMKRIGIIGTRRRTSKGDFAAVYNAFCNIYKSDNLDMIVSGGCPKGGDNFAYQIAMNDGISILIHFPNWKKYNRGAGFVRNTTIARNSDILIACVASDRKGGTEDTISKFLDMLHCSEQAAITEGRLIIV